MSNIDFFVVFSGDGNPKELLISLLKETLEDINGRPQTNEAISERVEIKYNLHRDEGQLLVGFTIGLDDFERFEDYKELNKTIIELFIKKIIDSKDDGFDHLLKFYDPILFSENQRYTQEIFQIEMRLREALSIVFIDTYGKNFYKLLKDVDVTLKENPQENQMKIHCENEFYFLVFSDYIKLSTPKKLSLEILTNHISRASDFAEFQKMLTDNPITNKNYLSFLTSLKEMVQPIENLRNCIAHNRTISKDVIGNYEQAKETLKSTIDEFLATISENDP